MSGRHLGLLLIVALALAFAGAGRVFAQAGPLEDLPSLQLNPWDFDPGDDGVSEGPLSGGGSGAGDPWPNRVGALPVWIRDHETRMHTLLHPRGVVVMAWTAWDGHDGEIALTLVDVAQGGRSVTRRVTDNRHDESAPLLVTSPGGDVGLAWETRRGPLSMLMFASVDLRAARIGEARPLALLGRRSVAAALALESHDRPVVVVARRTGGASLEIGEVGPRRNWRPLARIPEPGAASLELRPGRDGSLVLRWQESETLEGMLVRLGEGGWGSPLYRDR